MKKKSLTYLLLALTLFLWSFIGIEVFSIVDKKESVHLIKKTESLAEVKSPTFENYELLLDYEDPFLKSRRVKPKVKPKPSLETVQKPVSRPPNIRCTYKGLLKKGNKNLAMLQFGNKELMLFENQEKEGIRLLTVFEDSVKIEYSGHKYILYKFKVHEDHL